MAGYRANVNLISLGGCKVYHKCCKVDHKCGTTGPLLALTLVNCTISSAQCHCVCTDTVTQCLYRHSDTPILSIHLHLNVILTSHSRSFRGFSNIYRNICLPVNVNAPRWPPKFYYRNKIWRSEQLTPQSKVLPATFPSYS